MNPKNGEIYALASYPSYDLNEWVGGISTANFDALTDDGAENDYAIQGLYTPGSTFKLVTATAALQDGLITPTYHVQRHRQVQDPGLPGTGRGEHAGCVLSDDPGDSGGVYNVTGALTVSSDSFFYNLGDMFWTDRGQYGDTPIQNEADRVRRGHHHRHRPAGRGAGPGRQPGVRLKLHAEAPKAFPDHDLVHRRQHRDGLRAGRHRAHSD